MNLTALLILLLAAPSLVAQSAASQSARAAAQSAASTEKWLKLKNIHGWKIEYPSNWEVIGHGGDTPESDIGPIFVGPKGSCESRCVEIQIETEDFRASENPVPLREYVLSHNAVAARGALQSSRDIQFAGEPAFEGLFITYADDHNNLYKVLCFKHRSQMFDIVYSEGGREPYAKTPADWKFTATVDRMLSTFAFTN